MWECVKGLNEQEPLDWNGLQRVSPAPSTGDVPYLLCPHAGCRLAGGKVLIALDKVLPSGRPLQGSWHTVCPQAHPGHMHPSSVPLTSTMEPSLQVLWGCDPATSARLHVTTWLPFWGLSGRAPVRNPPGPPSRIAVGAEATKEVDPADGLCEPHTGLVSRSLCLRPAQLAAPSQPGLGT